MQCSEGSKTRRWAGVGRVCGGVDMLGESFSDSPVTAETSLQHNFLKTCSCHQTGHQRIATELSHRSKILNSLLLNGYPKLS